MKIIAQKTNFYLENEFFNEIITKDYVDGVSLDVIFNTDNKVIVYNTNIAPSYVLQQLQSISIKKLEDTKVLLLEDVLTRLENTKKNLLVYLNIVPVDINIIDDKTLSQLNHKTDKYIEELMKVLKKYPNLNISLHSVSRSISKLLQSNLDKNIGFVVYTGDLNPIDVNYYVFPTYMVDNTIFEELINRKKDILIYISDESDLVRITNIYDSEKTTALAHKIFPYLKFIVNHPMLMNKIFKISEKN